MSLQSCPQKVYILSTSSLHRIRESLQIILDYAERNRSEEVTNQVRIINEEFREGWVMR